MHKHKTLKFDIVGEWSASNSISKSTEQTEKSGKSASPQITAHVFCQSFLNGMGRTIWFSNKNFRFSHVSITVADQGEGPGEPVPPFFRPNWGPKGRKKDRPPPPFISGSGWQGFPPPLPEGLNPSLNSLAFNTFSISLSVQTSTVHGFAGLFISQAPIANV